MPLFIGYIYLHDMSSLAFSPRRNRSEWGAPTGRGRAYQLEHQARTSDARYQARARNCLRVPGGGALSVVLVSRVSIDF